ncbi:MAG: hypothetical protein GOMPHAMPRED_004428 [Gomphillus americanus]|uniref:Mitochondrial ribosomal protein subunit L20-domain-containing protein n=1 Tax=Gomphillus americanus TaxID=1940652 RepID=A0A8H3FLZ7_9LECA|nr:MAG: hypothetical protein GOMPHAMPRED_004428 [Gomphillus americanus]
MVSLRPATSKPLTLSYLSLFRSQRKPSSSTLSQTRTQATTRRTTKAHRNAPGPTATPSSKYLAPATPTIIFHPPPSAPSPYQTPPLFLPPSDPRKTLLAQSHAFNNPYASGARPLPPLVRAPAPEEKKYHLSEEDIIEIRRLRAKDPWEWTVPRLAEKFGCSKIFINIAAPATTKRREWGLALHQRYRDRWGNKRRDAVLDRHKRRELWEKDL